MKDNYNLTIPGALVVLVPYRKEHVSKYHAWMQSAALREATASEPLTLQEEYEMQEQWYRDSAKCTFIILDPSLPETSGCGQHGGGMVGDVNLYFNNDDPAVAEIEVMIAEGKSRKKGLAYEALCLFMAYAINKLGTTKFIAKIGESNVGSLQLFRKLGYCKVGDSKVFAEVTYELATTSAAWGQLAATGQSLRFGMYDSSE